MGDWRPDTYRKYVSFSLEDKIKVAENMRSFIQKSTVKFSLPMSYDWNSVDFTDLLKGII